MKLIAPVVLILIVGLIAKFVLLSPKTAQAGQCIDAPPLPEPKNRVLRVGSIKDLKMELSNIEPDTTILIEPGKYKLNATLSITVDDITIRGASNVCSDVEIVGPGMNNADRKGVDNGFWINAKNTTIANLTIGEVYFHTIQINNEAEAPHIYNVRMYNSGQQFVKANPVEYRDGIDNGIVEYSIMEYTDGPPTVERDNSGTGYTNGVDVHAGAGWRISDNLFSNFHTPDTADHLWNAAVLVWNGASGTITENNTFYNVDRAIAYGLQDKGHDHTGGIIRNNMIVMTPYLYSEERRNESDAMISVIDSPNTKVLHNTILTNGNTQYSIELRYDTNGSEVSNNITDAPISHRESQPFIENNNVTQADASWFVSPSKGNLRLRPNITAAKDKVEMHTDVVYDIDGQKRPTGLKVDVGADEFITTGQ